MMNNASSDVMFGMGTSSSSIPPPFSFSQAADHHPSQDKRRRQTRQRSLFNRLDVLLFGHESPSLPGYWKPGERTSKCNSLVSPLSVFISRAMSITPTTTSNSSSHDRHFTLLLSAAFNLARCLRRPT